jgi:hypothetical protein
MNLLGLPPELLLKILCFLDLSDLISYACTNHFLHTIIQDTANIQYRILLQLHGLTNNPSCSLSIAERLQLLKAREKAWETLTPNFRHTILVPHVATDIHDLCGGVLVLGEACHAQITTKALRHIVLPSLENDLKGTHSDWLITDPQLEVIDVCAAVEEHDLLAVVTQ